MLWTDGGCPKACESSKVRVHYNLPEIAQIRLERKFYCCERAVPIIVVRMVLQRSAETERKNWIADPGRRRSMRVLLTVPILVDGKTAAGEDFKEETRTLVVNAHGALISLAAAVAAGQKIRISNHATNQSLLCRVVYVGSPQAGKMQMGVEFEAPCPAFWQIDFPPEDWVLPES